MLNPRWAPRQKAVLITNCVEGSIGVAVALAFHKRGWLVFATARHADSVPKKLKNLLDMVVLGMDIEEREGLEMAMDAIRRAMMGDGGVAGLDGLVDVGGLDRDGNGNVEDEAKTRRNSCEKMWFRELEKLVEARKGVVVNVGRIVREEGISGKVDVEKGFGADGIAEDVVKIVVEGRKKNWCDGR